jgi:hypothetical protein
MKKKLKWRKTKIGFWVKVNCEKRALLIGKRIFIGNLILAVDPEKD